MEVISKTGTKTEKLEKLEDKNKEENDEIDSASALQSYLNSIPISTFPNLNISPVLEVEATDLLRDAMHKLYQNNASVALITDNPGTNVVATSTFSDCYIGVVSFASMVLWCFQQLQKNNSHQSKADAKNRSFNSFLSRLDQHPQMKQTKVAELAKLFLWDPFFPVHLEGDTLFHVLLLLSKHRLKVVPVIERPKSRVIGYITQNAVIKLLLKSDGLEWFDSIANSPLSKFRFERKDSACQVFGDQSVSEALSVLSDKRVSSVAVIDRKTRELVGTVRDGDIRILLENDRLLTDTKTTTLEEFIKIHSSENSDNDNPLGIKSSSIPRMDSPVIHIETDILKKVMAKMVETNSESSFLVDGTRRVIGMITLRDIIVEFAPPCLDSRINGGGFFESALRQTGCHVDNGTLICDQ